MNARPMNLALMSSQSSWGGGEQFLWSLGSGLAERGHRVLWIAPRQSPLHQRLQEDGIPSATISGRHPSPLAILRLRSKIHQHGTHVLHLNDSHAITWGTVSTLANSDFVRVAVKHTNFPVRSSAKYNWFIDRIACVSQTVYQTCMDGGILERKLQTITGSVPIEDWDRTTQRKRLVEFLSIDPNRQILLGVGSLIPCKGYERLIHAAAEVRKSFPKICVVLIGEGPERARLSALIEKLELSQHVRLLGFQQQPEQWIAGADFFVHPALSEGLPLVTMHAQVQGVPIVASDVGGLSELLRSSSDEMLGWAVSSEDPSSLTNQLLEALRHQDRSSAMAERGRILGRSRYSLDRMIDEYELMYQQLYLQSHRDRDLRRRVA